MRLIDADALFREMEKAGWYDNADRDEVAEELVMNAPTIESERTGRWMCYEQKYHTAVCSECNKVVMFEIWGEDIRPYDFCPNCGAKMEVEHE